MPFQIDPQLSVRIAATELDNLIVRETQQAYQELIRLGDNYSDRYTGSSISEIPGVEHARRFFRAIGIEPTRRRPSSEALLNRALKNKGFYSVNELVDVGNWCSLDFLLPIGIYD
ncbi:MAG: phenylalanine--tRNA ligase beta subunit-related protein, partial [Calditrichota bacterium]